jgi:hypothetical protein
MMRMVPLLLRWSAAATVFVIQAECGSEGSLLCDRGCNWRMRMCVCVEAPSLAAATAAAVAPEVKRPAQYVLISGLRGGQPGFRELQDCACQWVLTGRLGRCCQLTHLGAAQAGSDKYDQHAAQGMLCSQSRNIK